MHMAHNDMQIVLISSLAFSLKVQVERYRSISIVCSAVCLSVFLVQLLITLLPFSVPV